MAWAPFVAMALSAAYDQYNKHQDKKNAGMNQIPTMTPEQKQLLQSMMQMLGQSGQLGQGMGKATGLLQQLMDPSSEAVNQFAAPYQQQFEQQIVPGLAEKFGGMGAQGGALSSSGFGQALGAAGGNLQTTLAALKAGLGQQAAGQMMNAYSSMMGQGLGAQPFGYAYQPPGAGMFPSMMTGWAQGGFQGPWNK